MTLTVDPAAQRPGKLYYGWRILGVTMTLSFFATVMSQFFTGAMLPHIEESTGWNRSSITFAVTIGTVVGGLLSPTFGHLADRYGPRVISSAGVLIAAAAMVAVGLSDSAHIAVFYVAYLVGRTATQNAVGGVTAQTTMVNWFKRMRGRSIGLLTMGVPLGGAILVPLSQLAIDNGVSWEAVYCGFAAVMTLVLFPLAVLVLRRRPEDMGLLPDGDGAATAKTAEQERPAEARWTLREAMLPGPSGYSSARCRRRRARTALSASTFWRTSRIRAWASRARPWPSACMR
jgi:sugar phosphate permease